MRLGLAALALAALWSWTARADEDELTLGELEIEVASPERQAYEDAVERTKSDQCASAIYDFWDLLQNPKAKEFHQGSEYYIAKCLYRMGLYHAALSRFAKILEQGPENPYFETSREWLFFISRKIRDQEAVLDLIAQYADKGEIPQRYADEFHFLLAKYYYITGLGDLVPSPDEGRASEAETMEREKQEEEEGGFDFGADEVDGGGGDLAPAPGSGGDFDFTFDEVQEKPKKKKRHRKRRRRRKPAAGEEQEGGQSGAFDFAAEERTEQPAAPPDKVSSYRRAGALPPGEAMDRALQHLEKVSEESRYYAKALYLQGLVYVQREEYEKAVEAFRKVVRLTHPKKGRLRNPKLREMAFFSLARIHYGFKQFRYALFYYDKVSRDSEAWLDAIFESAWAYFRLGNYEKTLGNLITLHSPFFADEYYPESLILEAVTYYENCRYPEARAILAEFERQYGPIREELERLTGENTALEQYYELLEKLRAQQGEEQPVVMRRLYKLAMSDKGLSALAQSVREIDSEAERMRRSFPELAASELGSAIGEALEARKKAIVQRVGRMIRDKLQAERDNLKSLSSQLFRIKFEIAKMERQQIEAEMRGESMVVPLAAYRFSAAVDDEHEFYPFVGEYWRDELGTYEYTLTKGCRPESSE